MGMDEKTKEVIISGLKESLLDNFIDSTYTESDRFHVSMHETVDEWAAGLSFSEALDFLSQFDREDFSSLDSGLYAGVLEKEGFEKLVIVLAYCLAEQELYNDAVLNSLQSWEREDDRGSIALMKIAENELKNMGAGK